MQEMLQLSPSTMDPPAQTRDRALSHKDYLETLHRPNVAEWRRISEIQKQKEDEIDSKYHTTEEHEAATKIQKAYRGHRERGQLEGLTLDPSSRWLSVIKELKYRWATGPHYEPNLHRKSNDGRSRAASDIAKMNWQRVGEIAGHAVDGEARSPGQESNEFLSSHGHADALESEEPAESMLLDMRYFLEMVDEEHRYGSNLQVYHEEWLRSTANQNFFYWLDYGEGRHLDLPGCSRAKLDKERIRYLSKDERLNYLAVVDDEGKLRWHKNNELITTSVEQFKDSMNGIVSKDDEHAVAFNDEAVEQQLSDSRHLARKIARIRSQDRRRSSDTSVGSTSDVSEYLHPDSPNQSPTKQKDNKPRKGFHVSPATILNRLLRASIKPGTWIYVADTVGRLYVGIKASGAFQHASFLSGARISSAGSIGIENGQLTYLSPLSGHYRPTTKSFRVFINSLKNQGLDMSQVRVSHAYEVLLSMEYYGKSKKEARKVFRGKKESDEHRRSKSPGLDEKFHMATDNLSATSLVEQSWEREHRSDIGKLMDDLHISRRSLDGKKER